MYFFGYIFGVLEDFITLSVMPSSTQMEKLVPGISLVSMIVIGSRFLFLDKSRRRSGVGCLLTSQMVVVMGIEIPETHFQYQDKTNTE